jgi:GNAT superfamily N-acetyltransferase
LIVVTAAAPRDTDAIADLIDELDRFYGATEIEARATRLPQIKAALFSAPPAAYGLLAWDGERLVGLAAYSFLWPAEGVTSSLFLKELYVAQSHRRQGVGKLLMQCVCQLATDNQCSRVEWVTDEGNADAQRFYEELRAPRYAAKVFYRLEGAQLARLASDRE